MTNTKQELIAIRDDAPSGAPYIASFRAAPEVYLRKVKGVWQSYKHNLSRWGKFPDYGFEHCTGVSSLSDITAQITLLEKNEALEARVAELELAILDSYSYETEYDGRVYEFCIHCDGQDGEHDSDCIIEQTKKVGRKP